MPDDSKPADSVARTALLSAVDLLMALSYDDAAETALAEAGFPEHEQEKMIQALRDKHNL